MNPLFTSWQFLVFTGIALAGAYGFYKAQGQTGKTIGGIKKGFVLLFLSIVIVGGLWASDVGSLTGNAMLSSPLALAGSPASGGGAGTGTGTGTGTGITQSLPSGFCPGVEDTTVTFTSVDAYTGATTGGTHAYRVNGGPLKTVSDAGTDSLSPGNKLKILYGNESDTTYFGKLIETVVPCAGTWSVVDPTTGEVPERYANGTMTIKVFNSDGDSISGGTTETLGAGDVVTLDAEIKGSFQKGAPHGGIIYANYNSSLYDKVILDFGDGLAVTPSAVLVAPSSTQHGVVAYKVPAILSTDKILGKITLDVDDTYNPDGLTVTGSNITIQFRANDYFQNEDSGSTFDGPAVEDEDNVGTLINVATMTIGVA